MNELMKIIDSVLYSMENTEVPFYNVDDIFNILEKKSEIAFSIEEVFKISKVMFFFGCERGLSDSDIRIKSAYDEGFSKGLSDGLDNPYA